MLKGKNLVSSEDISKVELMEIIDFAKEIYRVPDKFSHLCDGKLLGTLFFEPSTRTRLSFESAMKRLGGEVVTVADANSSSMTKGESLIDTIRTVGSYVDIIALRHPKEGSAKLAGEYTQVSLINAGDGGHQHPTQTLTDLFTIYETKESLDNMTIGFCGDLKFGRTVHSLVKAISRFDENKFVFISPKELKIPDYIRIELEQKGIKYEEVENLEQKIGDLDILYMTRVQKERFFNEADYIRLKDSYILNNDKLKLAKKDLAILHPLPRVNEIAVEVDKDFRAKYFLQVKYGMIIRMSLMSKLLGVV